MSTRILVFGLVAAVVFPLAAKAEDPARAEQLTSLFKELQVSAKKRLIPGCFDVSVESKANTLVYDEQSIEDLKTVLKKIKSSDPTSIYAARVLLQPLLRAKPEVMLAGISVVDSIRKKAGSYKNFKQLSEAELEKCKFPPFEPGISAAKQLETMNRIQKLRDAKLKNDLPIQMHNIELRQILETQVLLILSADDAKEDKKLFSLFEDLDKKKLEDCFSVTANIEARAKGMKPERAKAFRDQCVKLGNELKAERREYLMSSTMSVRGDANSTVGKRNDYPGMRLLMCANVINKVLGDPEIKVPTTVEIDQYLAEKEKVKKQSGGRGSRK